MKRSAIENCLHLDVNPVMEHIPTSVLLAIAEGAVLIECGWWASMFNPAIQES